ncbi:hypothetical protein Tco_0046187 [Tanacetum coccineum]
MKLTTGRLIDGSSYGGIDMVIKDLDLETKIDAMMRDFSEQVLEMSPCFGDNGDTFDMWDITVEDVERIRQFPTSSVPDVIEDVIQPLILKTLHTTPPNEDYVALATKPIFYKLLEDNILNVAMVDEEADPTRLVTDAEDDDGYFVIVDVRRRRKFDDGWALRA